MKYETLTFLLVEFLFFEDDFTSRTEHELLFSRKAKEGAALLFNKFFVMCRYSRRWIRDSEELLAGGHEGETFSSLLVRNRVQHASSE